MRSPKRSSRRGPHRRPGWLRRRHGRAAGAGQGIPQGRRAGGRLRTGPGAARGHRVTDFVGRDELVDVSARVLAVTGIGTDLVSIFLDRSPFYAESGGQIGDTGTITTSTGTAQVLDTIYAVPGVHRHVVRITEGEILAGQEATASIDVARRDAIRRHHTATHIIHWALREVLGDRVKQKGSMVAPDRLRFDFAHHEPLTAEEIAQVEDLVNAQLLLNPAVQHPEVSKAEAETMGAIAFFGDKYGDRVRVLEAGPSLEFCGGTHVKALGDIGLVKIVSEGSIGSNLRRVEAVAGAGAVDLLRTEQQVVGTAADLLNVPRGDLLEGIEKRLAENKSLQAEIAALKQQLAVGQSAGLVEQAVDGVVVASVPGLERDDRASSRWPFATTRASAPSCWPRHLRVAVRHCDLRSRPTPGSMPARSSPKAPSRSREAAAAAPTSPWPVARILRASTRLDLARAAAGIA
ncbi:MAG: alanine--tRNA ligase-related protein [Acidimicrobiales bacterium]